MADVAVDAAIGAEPEQMEGAALTQQPISQLVQGRVGRQAAIAYGLADPHQLLTDDPAGANREMAHLRIAHLAVRQTHLSAAGLNQGVGIGLPEGIHHRCAGRMDRVVTCVFPKAPAIKDGQHYRGDFAIAVRLRS